MRRGLPADLGLIDGHRAPLVLLAAGLGSRFGGVKPVAPVGPDGEPLIELAVRQALAAGFEHIVAVVGPATEVAVAAALAGLPVKLARQSVPSGRDRPWGTVDAVLHGDDAGPKGVVVANADDLYGTPALAAARSWMIGPSPAAGAAVMFELDRTLSTTGGVSRAVPVLDGGDLAGLREHRGVHRDRGTIRSEDDDELAADTLVSMNLWCFRRPALDALHRLHATFLEEHIGDATAEHFLPTAVDALIHGGCRFEVLGTTSPWRGVTWADDVARVRAALMDERAGQVSASATNP